MPPPIKPAPSDFKMFKIILKNSGERIEMGGYLAEIDTLENCIKNNIAVGVIINKNIVRAEEVAVLLR